MGTRRSSGRPGDPRGRQRERRRQAHRHQGQGRRPEHTISVQQDDGSSEAHELDRDERAARARATPAGRSSTVRPRDRRRRRRLDERGRAGLRDRDQQGADGHEADRGLRASTFVHIGATAFIGIQAQDGTNGVASRASSPARPRRPRASRRATSSRRSTAPRSRLRRTCAPSSSRTTPATPSRSATPTRSATPPPRRSRSPTDRRSSRQEAAAVVRRSALRARWEHPVRAEEVAGVAVRDSARGSPGARARPPRTGPPASTSVTTLPGHSPDASTSAIVSSATRPLLVVGVEDRRAVARARRRCPGGSSSSGRGSGRRTRAGRGNDVCSGSKMISIASACVPWLR